MYTGHKSLWLRTRLCCDICIVCIAIIMTDFKTDDRVLSQQEANHSSHHAIKVWWLLGCGQSVTNRSGFAVVTLQTSAFKKQILNHCVCDSLSFTSLPISPQLREAFCLYVLGILMSVYWTYQHFCSTEQRTEHTVMTFRWLATSEARWLVLPVPCLMRVCDIYSCSSCIHVSVFRQKGMIAVVMLVMDIRWSEC